MKTQEIKIFEEGNYEDHKNVEFQAEKIGSALMKTKGYLTLYKTPDDRHVIRICKYIYGYCRESKLVEVELEDLQEGGCLENFGRDINYPPKEHTITLDEALEEN